MTVEVTVPYVGSPNEQLMITGYRVSMAIRDVHVVPRLRETRTLDHHLAACAMAAAIAFLVDERGWSSWVMTTTTVGVGVTVTVHCPDVATAERVLVAIRDTAWLPRAANDAYAALVR